jgi:cholesterol oxidase
MVHDAIIIGSGFGGAVVACRLAQAGMSTIVLERGRRWSPVSFPRRPEDPWIWNHDRPEVDNGWIDLRVFPGMSVIQGAGVGGGSLIYANVSCEAPASAFASGWPGAISYSALKPHYDLVAEWMDVQPLPHGQLTERFKLVKDAAAAAGFDRRFRPLKLAVNFDHNWTYEKDFAKGVAGTVVSKNKHGAEQGTCVHLGNCDIGCDVNARNTLDLNYLYVAENQHHTDVRPLHLADVIEPLRDGTYRVQFSKLKDGEKITGIETGRIVILAAGSLGSTELLLRNRDIYRTLPNISAALGHRWSCNGDFLTPTLYLARPVQPSAGPTITAAIDFEDGSQGSRQFWIQDGGFPNLAVGYALAKMMDPSASFKVKLVLAALQELLRFGDPSRDLMPWFAQGVDAGDGILTLTEETLFSQRGELYLNWDSTRSAAIINSIIAMHKNLAAATGGTVLVPPTWTLFRDLITPHPLGGCNMADTRFTGVVDQGGNVFGYPGLYVADGSVIPRPLGVNPSRTIAAIAEHIAAGIVRGR